MNLISEDNSDCRLKSKIFRRFFYCEEFIGLIKM